MPCNTPPPPYIDMGYDNNDDPNLDQYDIIEIDDEEDLIDEDDLKEPTHIFKNHTDAVFCCNFDKNGVLAVSGGQDEMTWVWDTNTGEEKFVISDHVDSVIATDFNHDSTLVASGGMDGKVQVWEVASARNIWSEDVSEITWMQWHPTQNTLFVGTVDGNCWNWNIPNNDSYGFFAASGVGTACGQLMMQGTRCIVGYMDGTIKLWDTDESNVVGAVTGHEAHSRNVISVASSYDGNLIASGSEDGTAKVIRSSNCRVLHTYNCNCLPADSDDKESVENVAFFRSHPFLATGTNTGIMRIFDLSTQVQRSIVTVDSPIVKMVCDDSSPLVYITNNGDVEVYDSRTGQLENKVECHSIPILDLAFSPDRRKLLTCSDDFTCRVFDREALQI